MLAFVLRRYLVSDLPEVAPTQPPAAPAPATVRPPNEPAEMVLPPVVTFERELLNGVVIHVPSNGAETQLIAFVADPARPPDNALWFTLDRVAFREDSATLTRASDEQLDNIAAILKAWPFVKVRFGVAAAAHENAAVNMKLSRDRATSILEAIKSRGITSQRLSAEGYGSEFPVAEIVNGAAVSRGQRIAVQAFEK